MTSRQFTTTMKMYTIKIFNVKSRPEMKPRSSHNAPTYAQERLKFSKLDIILKPQSVHKTNKPSNSDEKCVGYKVEEGDSCTSEGSLVNLTFPRGVDYFANSDLNSNFIHLQFCGDDDECTSSTVCGRGTCSNTHGSYICNCEPGNICA